MKATEIAEELARQGALGQGTTAQRKLVADALEAARSEGMKAGLAAAEKALHELWASASSPWRNEREEACAAVRALSGKEE